MRRVYFVGGGEEEMFAHVLEYLLRVIFVRIGSENVFAALPGLYVVHHVTFPDFFLFLLFSQLSLLSLSNYLHWPFCSINPPYTPRSKLPSLPYCCQCPRGVPARGNNSNRETRRAGANWLILRMGRGKKREGENDYDSGCDTL